MLQVMADIRTNSRWLKDLNVRHEIIKIVKEKNRWIFITLEERGVQKTIISLTPKADNKEKVETNKKKIMH